MSEQEEEDGMFSAVLAGKSSLQVTGLGCCRPGLSFSVPCSPWPVSGQTATRQPLRMPWWSWCSTLCCAVVAEQQSPWKCFRMRTPLVSFAH